MWSSFFNSKTKKVSSTLERLMVDNLLGSCYWLQLVTSIFMGLLRGSWATV